MIASAFNFSGIAKFTHGAGAGHLQTTLIRTAIAELVGGMEPGLLETRWLEFPVRQGDRHLFPLPHAKLT